MSLYEFKASLVYIASSRLANSTYQDPLSKKQKHTCNFITQEAEIGEGLLVQGQSKLYSEYHTRNTD